MNVALVFAGGAVGSLARYAVSLAIDPAGSLPLATLLVNLVGSFLLGLLVGAAAGARSRLLFGTGFLGGFTTYSALAAETEHLLRDGDALVGLGYLLLSVAVGAAAAVAGMVAGRSRA